ncbi:type I pullulanase [Maribacter sp. SA7]|uniref:type I pullulanase n=1 Tax=Maribacter zhoushanensis TaxID=3030012 RepID=UPI0023EDFF96|nr:type I pullulanase [Maribacter zhoushanensis]MDF4204961.1 type I pullulanase [Maribacter zhoushanensis]
MKYTLLISIVFMCFSSCNQHKNNTDFSSYPTPVNENLWPQYSQKSTLFKLWSPNAEEVILKFYNTGNDSKSYIKNSLIKDDHGIWKINVDGDLNGTYYTFQVKSDNKWLNETPGIYAQAVGVNGNRAMVIDMEKTNPKNWQNDSSNPLNYQNEAIIYELHIRDMTILPQSGSSLPGTYLGLVEPGTKGPNQITTGIDHLKELGITHVHLLPTFDHYAIDETKLTTPQFNWGYDPQNYNVPEGSFSTDPFNAEVRIKEFKQMVQSFHDNGIGVIMDVAYNHTGKTDESNFNQEVPGYYYRHWENGSYSDAAACGNETASERAMMRKFIIESVLYWTKEYHIDGFRFDLMGIHDIETMNQLSKAVLEINPDALLYGEGWTAKDSPLPEEKRALKKYTHQLNSIAAFSDDLRDGLKGSVFEDESLGFVSGAKNTEESIKFGIVGAIHHPQVNYKSVNYSEAPWTNQPWQAINYVSCHDNHTLFDKLKISRPNADYKSLVAMDKLANAIVLTSQGIPFLHAGSEMLRTKNGEHNSYNLPDSINQLNWNWKNDHKDVFLYYKNLIKLRKEHPAFHMTTAVQVREHLKFQEVNDSLVSFTLVDNANNDSWKNILVIYNASHEKINYKIEGVWQEAISGSTFDLTGTRTLYGNFNVPALSMYIAFQK